MVGVVARHGGKRGALLHYKDLIKYLIGGFRTYQEVDFRPVKRFIFVCKGNICRSAYAEAKFHLYDSSLSVASFGLNAVSQRPAYKKAIDTASQRGVSLSQHLTKTSSEVVVTPTDLLIAMEPCQATLLEPFRQEFGTQITLLGLWGSELRPSIADPYGRDEIIFDSCFDYIDSCTASLYSRYKKLSTGKRN